MKTARFTNKLAAPDTQVQWHMATVISTLSKSYVQVNLLGDETTIPVATHIPTPTPGQQVLVARAESLPALIIAAYPSDAGDTDENTPESGALLHYDEQSGTLSIKAAQLKLGSIGAIELRCGEAVLRLDAHGELFASAETITQAATGPYRIEGATVDIN